MPELADRRIQVVTTAWERAHRVVEALLHFRQYGYWLALADPGPWPDEDHPPLPPVQLLDLPQVRLWVRVRRVQAVVPHAEGELRTAHGRWRFVTGLDETLLALQNVAHLYYEADFTSPLEAEVRAFGLYRRAYLPDGALLSPSGSGVGLEVVVYRRRLTLRSGQGYRLSWVRSV
jgi:hypothetical protein